MKTKKNLIYKLYNLIYSFIEKLIYAYKNFFINMYKYVKTEIYPFFYSKYYYWRYKQKTFYKAQSYFSKKWRILFFFCLFCFFSIWSFLIFLSFSKNFTVVQHDVSKFISICLLNFEIERFFISFQTHFFEIIF